MTAPNGENYWEKEHIGCLFIYSGEKTRPALGRQGRGVALVLGPQMKRAWRASGSQIKSSGPRHLLIESNVNRLEVKEGTATAARGSAIIETIAQQLRSTKRESIEVELKV